MSRTSCIVVAAVVLSLLGGCVAPQSVKDASTQHAQNLAALTSATQEQRSRIKAYYQHLVDVERDAFVAARAQQKIDAVVVAAATKPVDDSPADATSRNFIEQSIELTDVIRQARADFDAWMKSGTPDYAAEEFKSADDEFRKLAAVKAKDRDAVSVRRLHELRLTLDQSACLDAARIALGTAKKLDGNLAVLAAQLDVMKAAHAMVDDFVSGDVTIDGAAVAKAMAKGAAADADDLTEVAKILPKGGDR